MSLHVTPPLPSWSWWRLKDDDGVVAAVVVVVVVVDVDGSVSEVQPLVRMGICWLGIQGGAMRW